MSDSWWLTRDADEGPDQPDLSLFERIGSPDCRGNGQGRVLNKEADFDAGCGAAGLSTVAMVEVKAVLSGARYQRLRR